VQERRCEEERSLAFGGETGSREVHVPVQLKWMVDDDWTSFWPMTGYRAHADIGMKNGRGPILKRVSFHLQTVTFQFMFLISNFDFIIQVFFFFQDCI
jgi:hypothetical protein